MKVYLASYAMVTMDKIIKNERVDFVGKTAVFIPTAADPYDNKDFVEADRDALKKYGLNIIDVDVKSEKKDNIREIIDRADIVLVAGGDTFYLMEKLKMSGADNILKEYIKKGGVYIGSSAGSIICCPTIEGAKEFDDPSLAPNLGNFDGMEIFNDVIIPHAQKEKYFERIKNATRKLKSKGYEVHLLTDNDVLFYDGRSNTVL